MVVFRPLLRRSCSYQEEAHEAVSEMKNQNPLRHRRGLAAKILLAVAAVVVVTILLETGARVRAHLINRRTFEKVFDPSRSETSLPKKKPARLAHIIRPSRNPRIIYELKPGVSFKFYYDSHVTVNPEGFRSQSYPLHKPQGVFRIVGLGDSVMFGRGVSDGEQYLALLEQELNKTFPDTRWQVVNTAVSGYNAVMEVETLKDKGLAYEPDLVIVNFVDNDLALPNFIQQPQQILSVRKSFLIDFVQEKISMISQPPISKKQDLLQDVGLVRSPRARPGSGQFASDVSKVPKQYQNMVGPQAYRAAMLELKRMRDDHGFDVMVVKMMPTYSEAQSLMAEVCEEFGFEEVSFGDDYMSYLQANGYRTFLGSPLTLSRTDPHPSALGHQIAAKAILAFMVREGITDQTQTKR